MITIRNKNECCGCGACSQICPKQCIEMKPDTEGFLYPVVNKDACINCGLCEKSCPILNTRSENTARQNAFIAFHRDEHVRMSSSSGGIFSALAENTMQHGGIVFGAAFDKDFLVHHIGVERLEELEKLCGSKYLQSRTELCYLEAKAALEEERPVLYSGTGCQIAGLKSFLGKDYPNLLTVDIVCHGVPTPKLWKRYLNDQEKKRGSLVKQVCFRQKDTGWRSFSLKLTFHNDLTYQKAFKDDHFMQMFLRNICLRPSCYTCKFKTVYSKADLTLGDCWGIEKYRPDLDDDKGLSVIIVHTDKGEEALKQADERLTHYEADLQSIQQEMMFDSVKPHLHRKKFFAALEKGSTFDELWALLKLSPVERGIRKLKRMLLSTVRQYQK